MARMQSGHTGNIATVLRGFLPAIAIIANSFAWYSSISVFFTDIVDGFQIAASESLMIFGAFYVGAAASAVLGARLFTNMRRELSLAIWFILGIFGSVSLIAISSEASALTLAASFFVGVTVGIGLPSCLAYFADSTVIENRGLLGGITWAVSGLAMFLLAVLLSTLSFPAPILALAAWRCLGLVLLLIVGVHEPQPRQAHSYSSILRKKTVILCLLPWAMFCIINWVEVPLLENLIGSAYNLVMSVEFGISGIFALVGGFFADLIGRKRLMIVGFILLGVEYAVLSLASGSQLSWYIFAVLDGITWGMFAVVFFMVTWGDLAGSMKTEKYYVVGGLPYLLAGFLAVAMKPYAQVIPVATAFTLASFFLFLAVVPLMYAPETLPEKQIKERELKGYVEKAKKTKEKYT
ncbi:hypothetical protein MUP59_07510 [Candidatus Bathyarchaeota archaeon]|nr:hypothetical protein [Candidatus Bathyarchaeota archaeon]